MPDTQPPGIDAPADQGASHFPFHFALLMLGIPALMLALGLILGTSPLVATGLAVLALALVFLGVGSLMRRKGFERRPGRHPVRPPSA